jgi:hypothetical protein
LNDANEISSVHELWFALLDMAVVAHKQGDDEALRRIYDYAHWSLRQPGKELREPVAVSFFEHLVDDARPEKLRVVLPWIEDDAVREVWGLWEFRASEADLDNVQQVLKEQGRDAPGRR